MRLFKRTSERGVAVYVTAALLVMIVPMMGLAIDGTLLYITKARLQGAVDGAALEGARALARGSDSPSQINDHREAISAQWRGRTPHQLDRQRSPRLWRNCERGTPFAGGDVPDLQSGIDPPLRRGPCLSLPNIHTAFGRRSRIVQARSSDHLHEVKTRGLI